MATLKELQVALRNADAAGDAQAAQMFADEIRRQTGIDRNNPAEGMSPLERGLAGAGKAMTDIGRGAGQLLREGIETVSPPDRRGTSFADKMGLPTREDIDYSRKLDQPLMNTTAGTVGNIGGSVVSALPMMMIPGANTIGGGALMGAAQGMMQPVGTADSRLQNAAIGGVLGGAIPAAVKTGKIAKAAFIDPITESGRAKIVGKLLRRASANPEEAIQNLETLKGATAGFQPTAGQASKDAGLASLERTAKAIQPSEFADIESSQQAALVNALRGVAGTSEQKAAAEAAREQATNALYQQAKGSTFMATPEFQALMERPSMQAAAQEAANLAKERGQSFVMNNARPQSSSLILDAAGNPMQTAVDAAPAQYAGQAMHDLKMGLDTALKDPSRGFVEAKRQAGNATRQDFLNMLEEQIPAYKQARETYSAMSKPINQQEIGQALYERFVPALADNAAVPFKSRADALAQALRNGDKLAKQVTGMKNAKLSEIMSPEQMATLEGVVSDSQLRAAAQNAGRGVGSDTVQKLAMSNLVNEAGVPSWISSIARVPGGYAKALGNMLYGSSDEEMRNLLATTLRNPEMTAEALKKAGVPPSEAAKWLRLSGQATALSVPAILQGQE